MAVGIRKGGNDGRYNSGDNIWLDSLFDQSFATCPVGRLARRCVNNSFQKEKIIWMQWEQQ